MHFLFPIPSVETVFPVSDLHCPFQATPSWARSHARAPASAPSAGEPHDRGRGREPPPLRPRPPWGGRGRRQLHVCKRISWGRGSKPPPSSWRFSTPPGRVPRGLAAWRVPAPNAGFTATAREFGEQRPARGASAQALGALSGGLPRPSRKSGVAPAPRVLNNRGPRHPRLSGSCPPPPPTSLRTETKPSGRLPPSPSMVSGESRGLRLAC